MRLGSILQKSSFGITHLNFLKISNANSNCHYLSSCKSIGHKSHPARFPSALPKFFVEFLTEPDDYVIDIFSGSNTTGRVCEDTKQKWLSIDNSLDYASLSAVRFMEGFSNAEMEGRIQKMHDGKCVDFTEMKIGLFQSV